MFHCSMEECGSATAKYIVYSVYRFIWCIIDQSYWSGPSSLVVITPDFNPCDRGSRPAMAECFYLQVYMSPPTTQLSSKIYCKT